MSIGAKPAKVTKYSINYICIWILLGIELHAIFFSLSALDMTQWGLAGLKVCQDRIITTVKCDARKYHCKYFFYKYSEQYQRQRMSEVS